MKTFLSARFAAALVMALTWQALPQEVTADDWMFYRSYFSHSDSPGYKLGIAPESRYAYRRAYYRPQSQVSIRSGYRFNNIRIFNGSSYDTTIIREYWIDAGG